MTIEALHAAEYLEKNGISCDVIDLLTIRKEKVNILHDWSMYETRKIYMNKLKTDNYKYPCIYTITQKDGACYLYSNENKGHFGIPKVIWSNGAGTYPIIDDKGIYGLTQFAYAIVDKKQNLQKIKDAMNNKNFINLMKYLNFKKDNKYNYKIIALFKKDFYKYFLPKSKSLSLSNNNKSMKKPKYNSI
jgi:hypothetical protein